MGQWLLYNIWQVLFRFKTTKNSIILKKYKRFLGLKRQKIVRMYKTCLMSQFLRFSLPEFPAKWRVYPRGKMLFESEIILLKCCKEVIVPLELVFFRIFRVWAGIFLCVSLCILFVRIKTHPEVANLLVYYTYYGDSTTAEDFIKNRRYIWWNYYLQKESAGKQFVNQTTKWVEYWNYYSVHFKDIALKVVIYDNANFTTFKVIVNLHLNQLQRNTKSAYQDGLIKAMGIWWFGWTTVWVAYVLYRVNCLGVKSVNAPIVRKIFEDN